MTTEPLVLGPLSYFHRGFYGGDVNSLVVVASMVPITMSKRRNLKSVGETLAR